MTKEFLAEHPMKYLLEQKQIWIEIRFSLETNAFSVSYLGVNVDKIPRMLLTDEIFQHEVVDISTKTLIKV